MWPSYVEPSGRVALHQCVLLGLPSSSHSSSCMHACMCAPRTDVGPCWIVSTVMVKTECERELSWFMSVAPTERFFLPTCPSVHHKRRASLV